ncbi:MAG TPA: hypothetical protein VG737_04275, partial [Cyclobacteriaceae bacterium]|nr:hypothetical protein [Cyclobacteriaceae bacterium]
MKAAEWGLRVRTHFFPRMFFALALHGFFFAVDATAQTNQQAWFEYMLNYPFANSWNLENAFSYSTTMSSPKWRAYDYSLTVERSITQHLDLIAQGVISYTNQTDAYNTLELRPVAGARLYLTPAHRIQTRLLFRLEQ